jgi:2'-5' RNA ligase
MPRLFTAVELPAEIRHGLARLRIPLPGAKWVEEENLHLTLRFAGDIDNRLAAEFADALAQVDVPAFELRLQGLGAFGGNDPRVLWAGVETSTALETLARANERAARAAGLPAEARTFKPHVTIARLRHARADAVAKVLGRHGAFRSPAFTVERFVLMSSRPQVGGGPYVVEEAFPLAGTAGHDGPEIHGW